jgi:hypothetical protein
MKNVPRALSGTQISINDPKGPEKYQNTEVALNIKGHTPTFKINW